MRLIDSDALIKFIDNRYDVTWKDDYEGGIKDACTDILEEINMMPTIEERKTGKWIPMEVSSGRDSWKCSVCGRRARGKLKNLPYCHCGAKMEGK